MDHNTRSHRGVLHHEEHQAVRRRMRGASMRVMAMLRRQISEMMD